MSANTPVTKAFQKVLEDLISEHKKKTGLTQNEMAKKMGLAPSAFSAYSSDKKEAGINSLYKIAAYFDVSTDYLLGIDKNSTRKIEVKAICDYTGLNDDVVEKLAEINADGELEKMLYAINALIRHEWSPLLFLDIYQHIVATYANKRRNARTSIEQRVSETTMMESLEETLQEKIGFMGKVLSASDYMAFTQVKAKDAFAEIVRDIGERGVKDIFGDSIGTPAQEQKEDSGNA